MIKPMLAQVYDSNKFTISLHSGVMIQPKLDGIRCIFTKDGAYSRAGNKFMNLAHLELKLQPFFKKNPQKGSQNLVDQKNFKSPTIP